MSVKRKPSSKKRGSINFSLIIIIVALIALLSYAISYLFISDATNKEVVNTSRNQTEVKAPNKGNTSIVTLLEGSWYSNYDGTILTISSLTFKLEFPGVEGSKIIHGSVIVNGQEVIFMNDSTSKTCTDKPGKYSWAVKNRNILNFTKINDSCKGRSDRMAGGWERI